jgi:hypothetical protein
MQAFMQLAPSEPIAFAAGTAIPQKKAVQRLG